MQRMVMSCCRCQSFVYGYCESIKEILQQELYEMLLRIVEV